MTDGDGLYATFFNTARQLKSGNGFADCNYRSLIVNDQRLVFSDLTKARRIGGGMRDACGTPGVDGCFRGKFKLTYFLKHYGRRGRAALNDLLLNHVLFFADPGIIKEAVFVAVTGVLEGNKVRLKWMHHSFFY